MLWLTLSAVYLHLSSASAGTLHLGDDAFTAFYRVTCEDDATGNCTSIAHDFSHLDPGVLIAEMPAPDAATCAVRCALMETCNVYGFRPEVAQAGTCLLLYERLDCSTTGTDSLRCFSFKRKVSILQMLENTSLTTSRKYGQNGEHYQIKQ